MWPDQEHPKSRELLNLWRKFSIKLSRNETSSTPRQPPSSGCTRMAGVGQPSGSERGIGEDHAEIKSTPRCLGDQVDDLCKGEVVGGVRGYCGGSCDAEA